MFYSNFVYCLVVIFIQHVNAINSYVGSGCLLDEFTVGICIQIHECPQIYSEIRRRRIDKELSESIKKIQCGFDGFTPLVCCERPPTESPWKNTREIDSWVKPTLPSKIISAIKEELFPTRNYCGRGLLHNKIYGGETADLGEYPWMALLGYKDSFGRRRYECGGSLINRQYILTAAHCTVGEIIKSYGRLDTIRLGEHNVKTNPDCVGPKGYEECAPPHQEIPVEKVIRNKGYNVNSVSKNHDIALVRMTRTVRYTEFIAPICLPDANARDFTEDEALYVSGWGKTLSGKPSDTKQKLVLPVFDKEKCQSVFSRFRVALSPGQLCAGGETDRDSCRGDSGGPLMKEGEPGRWSVVGVVSFGHDCGKSGWPGVYTNVGNYMDWIIENIEP